MEPFQFQPRSGILNWRSICDIDINLLMSTTNIDLLQEYIENITFCNINEQDIQYLSNKNFMILIKLYQCTIEYLLYVQNYLSKNNDEQNININKLLNDNKELQEKLKISEDNNANLIRDLKYYKKLSHSLEMFHPSVAAINPNSTPLNVVTAPNIPENPFMPISDKGRVYYVFFIPFLCFNLRNVMVVVHVILHLNICMHTI